MQGSNSCQTQKKMSFKSHVYFEPVRPRIVRAALDFLQRVNSLFCDPLIRDGNIDHIIYSFLRIWSHLLKKSLMENFIFCAVIESDDELESTSNPLSTNRHTANDSLLVGNDNLLDLAAGQDKNTKHILFDEKFEELAFQNI